MFSETSSLLADNNWQELIWPIALMVFYGIASIVKTFSERAKQKQKHIEGTEVKEEPQVPIAKSVSGTRYKPLEETAYSRPETPRARTLPYARAVAGTNPPHSKKMPLEQTPHSLSERNRQQEIKRRRLEQIEALRRKQLLEQQRQHLRQKAAIQEQRDRQRGAPVAHLANHPVATVRKAPQKVREQVQTAQAVSAGILSRSSVLQKTSKIDVPLRQASKHAPNPGVFSASGTLKGMLKRRDSLRTAFVLKELLDKPLALR